MPQIDLSTWVVLYPAYINSNRTIQEGRRIAKEKATPDPVIQEMVEAAKKLKMTAAVEVGCVRVVMCNAIVVAWAGEEVVGSLLC